MTYLDISDNDIGDAKVDRIEEVRFPASLDNLCISDSEKLFVAYDPEKVLFPQSMESFEGYNTGRQRDRDFAENPIGQYFAKQMGFPFLMGMDISLVDEVELFTSGRA
ncbi:hypothetical protein BABINDRAFT_163210 [Babjeviella inositovora NRRL Y-12698]|uniref:Uncharacterized protein n=1 Tax=Babjeviella inositovora NRRL Y-12698 TaxID=984486 RepID=A0A1E3QJD6_9ASCO|nr:uncharacterized protein BABINDRAFT_163210 [Babjeviella inositovora NRRL Y-12698]ODQ77823.1 hypothetical protein BABINDRAFT_163210 [Babjeviella inositovora NRRL Y-12698]